MVWGGLEVVWGGLGCFHGPPEIVVSRRDVRLALINMYGTE